MKIQVRGIEGKVALDQYFGVVFEPDEDGCSDSVSINLADYIDHDFDIRDIVAFTKWCFPRSTSANRSRKRYDRLRKVRGKRKKPVCTIMEDLPY